MVEHRLAKARVAGSNPVSRSLSFVPKPLFIRVSGFFCIFIFEYKLILFEYSHDILNPFMSAREFLMRLAVVSASLQSKM